MKGGLLLALQFRKARFFGSPERKQRMSYIITLLLFLFGSSPSVQSVQEKTRGGLDPWGAPTAETETGGGIDPWEQTTSEPVPGSETDTRGGLDPWG
jgi:hypothetical protein